MANLFIKKVSAIQLLELLLVQSSEEYIFLLQEIKLDLYCLSIKYLFMEAWLCSKNSFWLVFI